MTDIELQSKISAAVVDLRKKRGFTWQQAADQSGLNRCHYKRIEAGKSITLKTLNKILNFHEITLKEFSENI